MVDGIGADPLDEGRCWVESLRVHCHQHIDVLGVRWQECGWNTMNHNGVDWVVDLKVLGYGMKPGFVLTTEGFSLLWGCGVEDQIIGGVAVNRPDLYGLVIGR